jgi:predicted MPP superfamily phosphohydrolase
MPASVAMDVLPPVRRLVPARRLVRGRLNRRRFLAIAGAGAAGATAGVCLYTWRVEPHWLEIVRRPLPVRSLPSRLAGRTLVQISDVHVGTRVDDDYVLTTFRRVQALQPEIVVMTGDFISHHTGSPEQIRAVYAHFPKGRLATIAVLGNHDYGAAWSHPEVAQQVVDIVQPLGLTVLRNEVREIEGLQIAGLDDWWAKRFDPLQALRRLDSRRAALVLSHNPDTVDLPVWEGYEGWILSGHTHGGQCKPPFLPPPLLPVRNRRYTAGEFSLAGNRRLYVNRGVGHLTRVRFNVRPEVTLFELRPA